MKQAISTASAPKAIGPYSQAITSNGLVFLSGQIPLDPATGQVIDGGVEAQTQRVLENMKAVLEASGASLQSVLKTTVFLQDMAQFPAMNEVYSKFFTDPFPARSTVEVSRLPKDVLVEIECVATVSSASGLAGNLPPM
ncbi:MAG TPA: RidA family protein [Bryobacteraceae bacterium]|jgi:2-iminobutanoate/2-iminopropanoate deaminase|nr:RidA family protein [Bryobacteraceae bacterium]